MFSIDGVLWDLPCDITRTAEMKASELSGIMLDKTYFNDVLGTYMRYDVKIVVPIGSEMRYNQLYEMLSEPVSGHEFYLPYANGMITVNGHVEKVKDLYAQLPGGDLHWRGISFSIISNHPSKTMSLGEVVSIGLESLPNTSSVDVGSAYIYTINGWEQMVNADDVYY